GAAASDRADDEIAGQRDKYEARFRKAKRAYDDAVRTADSAHQEAEGARNSAILGFGLDLLTGRKPKMSSSSQRTAQNRARRAEDKIESTRRSIEDLNADLEDDLRAIRSKWEDAAAEIEQFEVGLEADDIEITDTRVIWIRK
ncbi:MAG: hypothetical protein ABFR53_00605, partial [Actinomycetota bacterium]